jgi:hypothetical protein
VPGGRGEYGYTYYRYDETSASRGGRSSRREESRKELNA